jgi:hypothetical protein
MACRDHEMSCTLVWCTTIVNFNCKLLHTVSGLQTIRNLSSALFRHVKVLPTVSHFTFPHMFEHRAKKCLPPTYETSPTAIHPLWVWASINSWLSQTAARYNLDKWTFHHHHLSSSCFSLSAAQIYIASNENYFKAAIQLAVGSSKPVLNDYTNRPVNTTGGLHTFRVALSLMKVKTGKVVSTMPWRRMVE